MRKIQARAGTLPDPLPDPHDRRPLLARCENPLRSTQLIDVLPCASYPGHELEALLGIEKSVREARNVLAQLMKESDRYVDPYHLAAIHVGLDEKEAAFTWLDALGP
jgi:hypothetical protein